MQTQLKKHKSKETLDNRERLGNKKVAKNTYNLIFFPSLSTFYPNNQNSAGKKNISFIN